MARERAERGAEPAAQAAQQPQANVSVAVVHQLVKLMTTSDIEEVTIESPGEGMKLTLRKPAVVSVPIGEMELEAYDELGAAAEAAEAQRDRHEIGAPLVGVFRTSMKPGGKALVAAGEPVREGQVVAAIEALQVLNEVEAPEAGTIREVLVEDGQPVEYGQPLFVVEPHHA
jgi:acetyl-CoA carboxylase biotin carboxyl carrier protein